MTRPRSIPIEDLALAYELRQEGCCFKRIAQGLGREWKQLADDLKNIELGGIHDVRVVVPEWALVAAHNMRTNSRLSWRSIGEHLGFSASSIRAAYSRRVTRAGS